MLVPARINVHVPFRRVFENLDIIRERQLDLEVYISAADLEKGDEQFIDLARALDYNPRLSIHAPFMDLAPGAVDPAVREVTILRYQQALRICGILKPELMVCHSGYDKWRFNGHREVWLDGWSRTWEAIEKDVDTAGVRIAVENIFDDIPEPLGMLMDRLPSDKVGVCFDTGHFNLFSRVPLADWTGRLGPRIIATHLHDNFREKDDHMPVGTATFDFPHYFRLLKEGGFTAVFTIETHDRKRIEESLANTRRLWTEV